MKITYSSIIPRLLIVALGSAALFTASLNAGSIPQNLGYGLDKLVESNLQLKAQGKGAKKGGRVEGAYNGYATEAAADYAAAAITDPSSGRFLVDITLSGRVPLGEVQQTIEARFPGFTVTAVDQSYRSVGIIEGYISIDDVPAISQLKGVRAVILGLKPQVDRSSVPAARTDGVLPEPVNGQVLNKLGTSFDQGVTQHRVDQINQFYNPSATVNWDGNGISIGAMSDSYNTRATGLRADTGVANFDLPGSASNPVNTKPVVVLVDDPAAGTDEGRGMIENIHKMAPKARIAFATGVNGEVAFGNYIRQMAGIAVSNPFPNPPAGDPNGVFKADVICDDISYGGEPFYGETIIGNAIDDATATGVSYFSSAGNNIGINSYEGALRIVPNGTGMNAATNTALVGTNIDLTGVPTNLYAGGFQNFNPNGQDVAQLWNLPASLSTSQGTEMQWDDPYDQSVPPLGPVIFTGTGTTNGTFNGSSTPPLPPFTAGQAYYVQETATSGNFDGIVTITDPNGNVLFSQDTGTDETIQFFAPVSGQYTITVAPFSTTTGNFTLTVNTAQATGSITSDFNLLLFRADTGAYFSTRSLTSNNFANNRPVELGLVTAPTGQTQVQFVIARANTPTAPRLPTRVRISVRGNGGGGIGPAEYFTYNAVTTKGHATAKGCNGTAAYSVFRPNLPESFTSPGPATILFDKNANLLATPEIRLSPTVAAVDAANTSDFSGDSASDLDTNPNFSGTSSAAPHAAGLAALVLQSHGGPGMVTPAQMRTILQTNVFQHDLDPSFASSVARTTGATTGGKVTITITSDNDANTSTGQNDPNSIVVSYVGPNSIASLTFNPAGTATTAGNVTGGNNGVSYSNYSTGAGATPGGTATYFENDFPGLVFLPGTKAFTLGNSSGLTASDVTAPTITPSVVGFSNLAPAPSNGTTQYWTMSIGFPTGNFTGGKVLRFTVGRGAQHSSTVGTFSTPVAGTTTSNPIADLFGGGVFIPRNVVVTDGMAYSGTLTDGSTFSGTIKNRIGNGYSNVDGYGLINAQTAVAAPLP